MRSRRTRAAKQGVIFGLVLTFAGVMAGVAHGQERYRALDTDTLRLAKTSDPETLQALLAGGAHSLGDYGSYHILETSAQALTDLPRERVEDVTYQVFIELNTGAVDTRLTATRLQRKSARPETGRRIHLVQFAGPVTPAGYRALEKTGVRIVDYIPHNAYLVYGAGKQLAAVRALAEQQASPLRFEGEYLPSDRVHPRARAGARKRLDASADSDLYQVQLVLDDEANAATLALIEALRLGPIPRMNRVPERYLNIVAPLPAHAIEALAEQPDVISIWPFTTPRRRDERQSIIVTGQLTGNAPSGPGYLDWLAARGFTQEQFDASGLVVDVTDSGIDNGTTNPNHFGLFRLGTTAGSSRVRYTRREGSANSGSTLAGCDGHGTINAHIVGGYVGMTGFPHTDAQGYRYGLGIAPFVKVGSSVIFDPENFTFPDYEDLASRAYRDGARLSGNSWGADTAGGYDADAQAYDRLVRDAQPSGAAVSTSGNQQMTFFFAAGNAGSSARTVGSPGTAKNVITVGAAENVHAFGGADGCSTPDSEANSANDMATFSSRGPCSDGRRKPEIVAPGTHISGGVAQAVRTMSGSGSALACYDGEGVCGGSGNSIFHPSGQQFYTASSGTSHSTPALAGGGALVYQWFLNQYGAPPSPAMIKAFLVHSTRFMTGSGANDTLPSNSQGYGMMNLGLAFDGAPRFLRDQAPADLFTASGQTRVYTGTAAAGDKPLRITLCWTDAPGSTSGNAYRNDLDLTAVVNGITYRGNVFNGAQSVPGGSADRRNNTECIFLPAGVTGAVVITVSAANINSDGVPNTGGGLDQDFALVAYNFQEVLTPAVVLESTEIISESCGLGNQAIDPDETVTVLFTLRNIGSLPTTNLVATLESTGGVVAPSGPQFYGALAAGGAAVTRAYTFTATGICGGLLTATLDLQDGTASLGKQAEAFPLGGASAATAVHANPAAITIRDNNTADPYPSTITVSGLAGTLNKVTATLQGFTHTYPEDVDVLLVGPQGQRVALMGSVGGSTDAVNTTITFDDAAASPIGASVVSGTFQPSGGIDGMPAPAPSGPYASELSAFNGSSPNGTWSLYVRDAVGSDAGVIGGGWRLDLDVGTPLCCASNQPPLLATIGNRTVIESNSLNFIVSAMDPFDGDAITLSASNLPPGAVFGPITQDGAVTQNFFWAQATPPGVYTTSFHAVDKDGMDSEVVRITVQAAGTVAVTNLETFDLAGNWGGGAAGAYNLKTYANDGLDPVGDSFLANSAVREIDHISGSTGFAWRIGNASAANVYLRYIATNRIESFSVKLARWDNSPTPNFQIRVSADSGATYTTLLATNGNYFAADKAYVTYASDALDLSPSPGQSVFIEVLRTSGERMLIDDFTISTLPDGGSPRTPPILMPIGSKSVLAGNALAFAVLATPTDGDVVTLSANNLPAGASFTADGSLGYFVWPQAMPVGTYAVDFHADDVDGRASETVSISVQESGAAATETFSNLNAPAGTYGAGSYAGDGGIVWTYQGARKPDATYFIDGQSIGFGDSTRDPRMVTSQTIEGGIGSLSVKSLKYFTSAGSRSFDLYVNDQLVGTVSDANNTSPQTYSVSDINIAGPVVLKIVGTGGKQFVVDSLAWTGFSGPIFVDTDGDGIDDQYELDLFGSLTNINATSDWDGDGFIDGHEYRAGTSPTNALSLLKFMSAEPIAGDQVVIRWQSASNRIYGLWRSLDPALGFAPLATGLPATPPENTYTDAVPPGAQGAYRIDLEFP